mmetsp:Transcript_98267/g.276334  ORF Transcript_98267/g.276334 Transcript_98267/m.276334 type:complete len:214 (-) Transcript_98267:109-750(-)
MEDCGARRRQASSLRKAMSSCSSAGAARAITWGTTVVSQRRLMVTHPYHKPSLSTLQSGSCPSSEAISTRGVRPCLIKDAKPLRTSSPQGTPSWHQQTRGPSPSGAPKASAVHIISPCELISRTGSPIMSLKTSVPTQWQVPPPTAQVRHIPSNGLPSIFKSRFDPSWPGTEAMDSLGSEPRLTSKPTKATDAKSAPGTTLRTARDLVALLSS